MSKPSDIRCVAAELHLLPLKLRVPLKFGPEPLTHVTCARVRMRVEDRAGRVAEGWGETPLSVQWVWPSTLPYDEREQTLIAFCRRLVEAWPHFPVQGHALEVGHAFIEDRLPELLHQTNVERSDDAAMPHLAALVCDSAFDIALHDAYGKVLGLPVYETYTSQYLSRDLSAYLEPAPRADLSFTGRYPAEFLVDPAPMRLPAWHVVGGLDAVDADELTGSEPDDGYPVTLRQWIERDGLLCLKIKLTGLDFEKDYDRTVRVGQLADEMGVHWLSTDFNCAVTDPEYVNASLDRLRDEHPRLYGMVLYVEQPFPYDLERYPIDVHGVSARKPLFMDESAHDWELVRMGRQLGWSGVALKTCKTQTGALLSLCWAKAHGMTLMVQDLTNPMLAIVPHVLLAAHAGTIMGVEVNACQFYPDASKPEAAVHPGLYQRRDGQIDFATLQGPGFGYRVEEIERELP